MNQRNIDNKTALCLLCEVTFGPYSIHSSKEHTSSLDLLLNAGVDVNLCDNFGKSPLHSAVRGGHEYCVMALITSGTDVNKPDTDGVTPLMDAVKYKRIKWIDLLICHVLPAVPLTRLIKFCFI